MAILPLDVGSLHNSSVIEDFYTIVPVLIFPHMVKHGSSQLRYALMNCCLPLITHEPVFAEYYAKKRAQGKTHRVALTHVAKKLLRVIYTLQTKNVRYDPNLIR